MNARIATAVLVSAIALVVSASSTVAQAAAESVTGSPVATFPLGWSDELGTDSERLDVATTVAPISSIARNIGGDRIRLRGIVPDATNSHTFEPSPSDARVLAQADMLIANGLHLEQPTFDLAEASMRPDAPIHLLADATIGPDEWLFDFSFPASEGDPNPHLWMNVQYAQHYAELIKGWLAEADPANADYYASNLMAYSARLDDLDARIRDRCRDRALGEPEAPDVPRFLGLLGTRVRLCRHRRRAVVRLFRPQPS